MKGKKKKRQPTESDLVVEQVSLSATREGFSWPAGIGMAREASPRYGAKHGYSPPYNLTPSVLRLVAEICEALGKLRAAVTLMPPRLQRGHRILSVQASCAIEGNRLNVEQVTALLEGKRVLGSPREIKEVRNAFAAYEQMEEWSPHSRHDLLTAHGVLMAGLVDAPGRFRTCGVGIRRG